MKTTTINKKKSMVEKMRDIRENLSLEIIDMSLEQQKEFIKKQLQKLKKK